MASSLFVNTVHICFDSVLAIDNQGMVAMFESLVATGLKGFLGFPAVLHEAALLEFFENGSVRDGLVVSTVNCVLVEISEQLLAEKFELPVEGLSDLSEISKDLVVDARSIVSLTGEPVSMSGKKKEMKIEFRLLCDIMAKTISIKAGSFDAITKEKFLMIAGITCGVQVNWNKILFNILKDMVTAKTRQARGYAIQISLLLENISNLELGESTEFPSLKILTEKTVHRYIILNDRVGGEDVTDAPRVKRTPVKRAVSKKRPAAVDTEAAPIMKKKRTTKRKAVSSKDTLDTLPVEAVSLQMIAPTTAALTKKLPVPKRPTQKRNRRLILGSDDEIVDSEPVVVGVEGKQAETSADSAAVETIVVAEPVSEPAVADVVNEGPSTTDDVDDIIQQVLTETAQIGANEEEIDGGVDISRFVSTIAMDKIVLRNAQIAQNSVSVAPSVQLIDEHPSFASTSEDSSMHFDETDTVATSPFIPTVSTEVQDILAQLRASVAHIQVIAETAQVETDVGRTNDSGPDDEDQGVKTADETELWFNLSYEEFSTREANRPVETGSDTEEEFVTEKVTATDVGVQTETGSDVYLVETSSEKTEFFQGTETATAAPTADKNISDDESMTLEAILSNISDDLSLPSTFGEISPILFVKSISIPGVDEGDWYKASLPDINPADKGKAPLQERDPVLDMLSNLHLFVLEELKILMQAHGLTWERTCCSKMFEGRQRDRGAVIARSNPNIHSSCWIRTMLRINGTWVIEPCADYWKQIPRAVASSIVVIPSRLSYVDTLLPVSEFFKLLKKRWADVCIEAAAFVVSGKLLPVGSLNFCRAIAVVQPVSVFGFQRPTVTSWGWSQLCTEFFRYSLFSGLLTVDFSISGSATVLIRPSLGSAYIFYTGVHLPHISFSPASVFAPDVHSITSSEAANQDVQMDIDRHGDSPDSSVDSSLHFNANDISMEDDAALDQFILPSSAADISASLAALWESFSKIVANQTRDSRKSAFRGLFKSIRQEAQNDNNALSLALKAVRAQTVILSTDLAATQKEVKDLQAALSKDFDDKLADIRNDLLQFRVETQEQLASLGAHIDELIAFITKGSDDKKGEGSRSRPQPPPDDQNRPSGGSGSRADDPSRYDGGTVSREGGNRGGDGRRRGDSSGSSKSRRSNSGGGSGGRINYGPYLPPKRDAEYWILGKRQFYDFCFCFLYKSYIH
ncbi:hypothetical protein F511_36270 [Dorcoceras hygrometricum]|uniref:Dystroglycan-like n=1 Tax=Dorcoceras hygrometricum TaxID=472368 RepID=A0A2Z7BN17_9LAMI|nr:hypothetical protein F511_36270 [Dorcoceras hygrometricum]